MTLVVPPSSSLKVGLLGFGVVGKGIYEIIMAQRMYWVTAFGVNVDIVGIAVKNPHLHPEIIHLLSPLESFLQQHEIDVLIAVTGDDVTLGIIIEALQEGKKVITANKRLVSNNFDLLANFQTNSESHMLYEASVASGIPIIAILQKLSQVQKIESISGILNGTCNYILTQMEKGLEFDQALAKAQSLGFAEEDPTSDLTGQDSAYKLSILAAICQGKQVHLDQIHVTGIQDISLSDVRKASDKNLRIRLVASYNPSEPESFTVSPVHLCPTDPLYNVVNEENAIIINGSFSGDITFLGKGAGRYPAASGVIQDLVEILKSEIYERSINA